MSRWIKTRSIGFSSFVSNVTRCRVLNQWTDPIELLFVTNCEVRVQTRLYKPVLGACCSVASPGNRENGQLSSNDGYGTGYVLTVRYKIIVKDSTVVYKWTFIFSLANARWKLGSLLDFYNPSIFPCTNRIERCTERKRPPMVSVEFIVIVSRSSLRRTIIRYSAAKRNAIVFHESSIMERSIRSTCQFGMIFFLATQ